MERWSIESRQLVPGCYAALPSLPRLARVNLEEGGHHLLRFLAGCAALRHVDINARFLDPPLADLLSEIGVVSGVTRLEVRYAWDNGPFEVDNNDLLAVASAFPNLESLDLGYCFLVVNASSCRAVLPRLRRLQAACSSGLLEGATLKRVAPALESLLLGSTFDLDLPGSWEGHASLQELTLEYVPYFLPPPQAEGDESSDECWNLPDRTCLLDLAAVHKLPALRSLRVGLASEPGRKPVSRLSLDAGATSLRAWAGGWTQLRELWIGGASRCMHPGLWFDIGSALPMLAEQLGPHLRSLAVEPCSFVCGASDFESLPACLRACIPQFRVLESFLIRLSPVAGRVSMGEGDSMELDGWVHSFEATPELLEGLVGPLAGHLRPPRLQSAKVLLPIGLADRDAMQDEAWVAAFLCVLNGYPGLHVEMYKKSSIGSWGLQPHMPWCEF